MVDCPPATRWMFKVRLHMLGVVHNDCKNSLHAAILVSYVHDHPGGCKDWWMQGTRRKRIILLFVV